jgi:lipopolysaccharide/colanic/teichoic acid biosynthesis glycosyltransferase
MLPEIQQRPTFASNVALQKNELENSPLTIEWQREIRVSLAYRYWFWAINVFFGVLGTLLLLVLLPLFALCISLDSRGPIFYTQERLGRFGRPFRIYKFRSMRVDAEPDGRPIWAVRGDGRVTRVGHILRLTHLDELPQVVNILQGHMSLIGPRPEREAFAARLEQLCPLYRQRLVVKPGVTGWAQVKYGYGAQSSELQKLHYDLEYIQQRSIRFDIAILGKTIIEVLTLRGR